ncbi:MAG: hypothetical protein OXG15_10195 [Gammaproteobacteria bacterium]|nr:hypothetical protein [Gammaproteobacteria bacterium]
MTEAKSRKLYRFDLGKHEFNIGADAATPLSVDIEKLKSIDSAPMLITMPLMKLGSEMQGHDQFGDVDQEVFDMVSRGIHLDRVPAYMGHGSVFGRETDDGGVGHWIGVEQRGDTLFGSVYINKHSERFRSYLDTVVSLGIPIGSSMVVGDLWDSKQEKVKKLSEGTLRGIDFLAKGSAAIEDSEAVPHISYLEQGERVMTENEVKQKEAQVSEEAQESNEDRFSALEKAVETLIGKVEQLASPEPEEEVQETDATTVKLQEKVDAMAAKLLFHELGDIVAEYSKGDAELAELLTLFVWRNDSPVVSSADEGREILKGVMETKVISSFMENAKKAAHGPKSIAARVQFKREMFREAENSLAKTFDKEEDEKRFLQETNERLGLPT